MRLRLLLVGLLGALALAAPSGPPAAARAASLPPIGHVFVVMLENQNADTAFGPNSPAPVLAHDLPAMGQFLPNFYGIAHQSLTNYIALISGQGPNPLTQSDCQVYTDVSPGSLGAQGQATGAGCVYPSSVQTVADQLAARGLTWKGYMEDMGNSPGQSQVCRHPPLNSPDDTQTATAGDAYAARHNPFVYFHSITDSPSCQTDDVPLDRLAGDLGSVSTTANFSLITPNVCHDGHDSPCQDGEPGGLTSAGAFLASLVPQIVNSPAFRQDGLLIVTFDESAGGAEACCSERAANTADAGGSTPGPGGGRVGAVLVSPFIPRATVNTTPYNYYGLLRSVEDFFGLGHLGYAAADGLSSFGDDVFNPAVATSGSAAPPSSPAGTGGCTAQALPRGARGDLRRGMLIASARLRKHARHPLLTMTFTHDARLNVRMRNHGRIRRLPARAVGACRVYVLALPAAHGQVTIQASVRGARERRLLRV